MEGITGLSGSPAPTGAPSSPAPAKPAAALPPPYKRLHMCNLVTPEGKGYSGSAQDVDPSNPFLLNFGAWSEPIYDLFKKQPDELPVRLGGIPWKPKTSDNLYQTEDINIVGDKACITMCHDGSNIAVVSLTEQKMLSFDKWYGLNAGGISRACFFGPDKILASSWDPKRGNSDLVLELRDLESCKVLAFGPRQADFSGSRHESNLVVPHHIDSNMFFYADREATHLYDMRSGLKSPQSTFASKSGKPKVTAGYGGGPGTLLLTDLHAGNFPDQSAVFDIRSTKKLNSIPKEFSSAAGAIHRNMVCQMGGRSIFDLNESDWSTPSSAINTYASWCVVDDTQILNSDGRIALK
eukprot:TRINITY_DN1680_c0_g1_i1.p1 TRINITY_DN1680_c0_g1~~TRINITY_DN1680_c0_g1_i1.p1  ORF type:complete len:352 (+),score=86.99 TRINITY_DN1680_c0_g1_i1:294-1349(+)